MRPALAVRPRLHRVLAPVAILAAAAALLAAGLVMLAASRRFQQSGDAVGVQPVEARRAVLRACADPNDMPFSNARARDSRTGALAAELELFIERMGRPPAVDRLLEGCGMVPRIPAGGGP